MSLKLEEDRAAPPPDSELVLVGFRNDLARRRVLELLRQWTTGRELPAPVDDVALPYTVGPVDAESAKQLSAELDRLGALVRVKSLAPAAPPPPDDPLWARPSFTVDERAGVVRRVFAAVGVVLRPLLIALSLVMRSGFMLVLIVRVTAVFTLCWVKFRPLRHAVLQGQVQQAKKPRFLSPQEQMEIRSLVSEHDYSTALDRVERALQAVPDDEGTAEYRWRLYTQWVGYELQQGRFNNGLKATERALAIKVDPAIVALQAEILEKKSDWDAAQAAYEKAIQLGSKDPKVFISLAAIYRQTRDQDAAIDMIERAQENGARGDEFEQLKHIVTSEQGAESDFASLRSPHFTISFAEGEDREAARLVLSYLESPFQSVGHKLGHYPKQRTPVVIYPREEFQRVTHTPDWAGGLFDGRIKVPVRGLDAKNPELPGIMRHEYAHVVALLVTGGNLPVWLNEGVAMWAEETRDGEREEWARTAVHLFPRVDLKRMERSFGRMRADEALAAYAQSYLAVRYILNRYGQLALQRLLVAFSATDSMEEVFKDALSTEVSEFERELRSFIG